MSKELKALNRIKDFMSVNATHWKQDVGMIETALKALEIIKEKKVNLEYLKCCETYEQYKTICSYWNEITQEEFDLLKEVLL